MEDRLRDLFSGGALGHAPPSRDVEMQAPASAVPPPPPADPGMGNGGESEEMKAFLAEIGELKYDIQRFENEIESVAAVRDPYKQEMQSDMERGLVEQMERHLKDANDLARKIKSRLRSLEKENRGNATAESHIRDNLLKTLNKKFMDDMKTFFDVQTEFKSAMREKNIRLVRIVAKEKNLDDSAVEELADAFIHGKTYGQGDQFLAAIQADLSDVQQRYKGAVELEASLRELQEMFLDLARLVHEQGEWLDTIEFSVENTVEYVEKGTSELVKANRYLNKARKKKVCLMLICIVVIIVILAGAGAL